MSGKYTLPARLLRPSQVAEDGSVAELRRRRATHRLAGVGMHFASLPGRFGIGEIGEQAFAFVDALAHMQLGVWQFLPTGPTGYGDSPYLPLSAFAGNEMLIDVASLVRSGLLTRTEADSLDGLPIDAVAYGALIPRKSALLLHAADRFETHADAAAKSAFDDFMQSHDRLWLHDYALFRLLKAQHGEQAWPSWAPEYVHREPQALRRFAGVRARAMRHIKILQFLFADQWRRLREYAAARDVLLFGDMPIFIALDSSDTWARRELVRIDADGSPAAVAGVPPDYFSASGQLWGNPVYDWNRHSADGYAWWIDRLGRSLALADIVRIDHFRGFESCWSVPADAATARAGEWIPGPGDALFHALRAALGELPIVAEDLGVITPAVEALRNRHRIPGMKVLQFEVANERFSPGDIGPDTVCYTGTHDNDTTLGWFAGGAHDVRTHKEVERQRQMALALTGGQPETIHNSMIQLAFSTPAWLAVAPLQDYLGLGSAARLNIPGTSGNNWRWRLQWQGLSRSRMDAVAAMVHDAGRLPRA